LTLLLSIYSLIHYLPFYLFKELNSLYCTDVPLRNYSLTSSSITGTDQGW